MWTPHACPSGRHRLRAHLLFDRPAVAMSVIDRAIHEPRRNETVALLLDHERRGVHLVSVTNTHDPDDVVEVVELLTSPTAHQGRVDAFVLASVWSCPAPVAVGRTLVDRWLELHEIAADHGVELLDWFEFSDRVTSLRVESGAPSRW